MMLSQMLANARAKTAEPAKPLAAMAALSRRATSPAARTPATNPAMQQDMRSRLLQARAADDVRRSDGLNSAVRNNYTPETVEETNKRLVGQLANTATSGNTMTVDGVAASKDYFFDPETGQYINRATNEVVEDWSTLPQKDNAPFIAAEIEKRDPTGGIQAQLQEEGKLTAAPSPQQAIAEVAETAKTEAATPQQVPKGYTVDDGIRQQQLALAQQIYLRATGQVPSAAELLLNKANQQSMRQQLAASASVRGGANAALAARNAQNNMAMSSVENAQNAAILRAQEQQQAEGTLGQVLGNIRGQEAQEGQFNQNLDLEGQKFVEGRKLELMKLGLSADVALLQAQQEAKRLYEQRREYDSGLQYQYAGLNQQGSQFQQSLALDQAKFEEQQKQFAKNYKFAQQQAEQAQSNADRQFWLSVGSAIMQAGATTASKVLTGGVAG